MKDKYNLMSIFYYFPMRKKKGMTQDTYFNKLLQGLTVHSIRHLLHPRTSYTQGQHPSELI